RRVKNSSDFGGGSARVVGTPQSLSLSSSARAAGSAGCFGKPTRKKHTQKVLGFCRHCRRLWQRAQQPEDHNRSGMKFALVRENAGRGGEGCWPWRGVAWGWTGGITGGVRDHAS